MIAYYLIIKIQTVCRRINAGVVRHRKNLSAILNSQWNGDYLRVREINI